MVDALQRELREELGIEIDRIQPAFFKDGTYDKRMKDGSIQPMYLIFLIFHCHVAGGMIQLNEEFSEYRWVKKVEWDSLDLNPTTRDTLARIKTRQGPL